MIAAWSNHRVPYHARSNDPDTGRLLRSIGALGWSLRVAEGLTQLQLEQLCGVDQTTISRFERGRAPGLRLEQVAAIMAVLGVNHLRPHVGDRRRT